MAAEAMAQKTDASEIKEAIVRIRTISTGSRKSNASGFFIKLKTVSFLNSFLYLAIVQIKYG